VETRLVRLYVRLLAWLPQGFSDEFAEEMGQVAAARMGEAGRRGSGALLWILVDELRALPGLWLLAYQRERRASCSHSGKETVVSGTSAIESGRPSGGRALGLWWVLATMVGWLLPVGLGMLLPAGLDTRLSPAASFVFRLLVVVALGAAIAATQWLVLRRWFSGAATWLVAGGVGVCIGTAAGLPLKLLDLYVGRSLFQLDEVAYGAVFGAVLGAVQWLALRRWVRRSGWWIVASTAGWMFGMMASMLLPLDWASKYANLAYTLAQAGIAAAVTGAALVALLRNPLQRASGLEKAAKGHGP
jgi:hypothetical protein